MKNFLILAPVMALILTAGYLLYKDYHTTQTLGEESQNREAIGQVISKDKNVVRQFGQDILWNEIKKSDVVYLQDSIRTGKDSGTIIQLNDKTIIEVAENSLVVLDKYNGNLDLKFKTGDIELKNTGQKLQIQVNNGLVNALGSNLKIKSEGNDKARVVVAKGKATITDKNSKTTSLSENESASLDRGVLSETEVVAVQLRSPEDKTEVSSNDTQPQQVFTWAVNDKEIKYEIFEISTAESFPNEHTRTLSAHQAITGPLYFGNNYWRVGWNDTQKKRHYTETRLLTLGHDKRLFLVYPDEDTKFQMDPNENHVDLQWRSSVESKVFVVDVSRSRDFRSIVKSETVKGAVGSSILSIKNLETGIYYWRIKAFGQKNELLALSNVSSFGIKLKLPQLPELLRPNNDDTWGDPGPVGFEWKKMESADQYRINISTDSEQKNIIKTQVVKDGTFTYHSKARTTLFWSVMALNKSMAPIGRSETWRINIAAKKSETPFILINPVDNSQVDRSLASKDSTAIVDPVLFQWKVLRPLPGPITLEVANNPEFKDAQIFNDIKRFSQEVTLKIEGKYYWHLSSQSPTNQDLLEKSPVFAFFLRNMNLIPAPQLISPEDKEKIESDQLFAVKFTWKPVEATVQYHIRVLKLTNAKEDPKTVIDKILTTAQLVSTPLPEGQYQWSVTSVDQQGQEGVSSRARTFSIIPVEQLDAPQLNVPVVK